MGNFTPLRVLIAILIGLIGAEIVWIIQPYNNFVLNNSYIADNYIPELVIGLILFLVLLVNPILRFFGSSLCLDMRQLALIFGIMLVSVSLSQTMRIYPHSLAKGNMDACQDIELARLHEKMDIPKMLYLDPVKYGAKSPVSEKFFDKLQPGEKIPWGAWLGPLFGWGTMIMGVWIMMVGLAMILFSQWKDNERLPFPLLAVQQEFIETPEEGRILPPIFYEKFFWIALIFVLSIHSLNGINHHTQGLVPKIPLNWNLWSTFSEGMWRHINWDAKAGRILFIIVGITFFMPTRVGFSLWFVYVLCQIYRMIGYEYMAPFRYEVTDDLRSGAVFAVSIMIVWLGRQQWKNIFAALIKKAENEVDRRNRVSCVVFLFGCFLLYMWLLWVGTNPVWAFFFVLLAIMSGIILSRIVCETGLPFLALYGIGPRYLMSLLPGRFLDLATCYIGGFLDMMLSEGGSRTSAAVLTIHALGIDKKCNVKQFVRLGYLFIFVLMLGILLCGITHIVMGYHYSGTIDGLRSPVSDWGSGRINITHNDLKVLDRGAWDQWTYNKVAYVGIGALLGSVLQALCLFSPSWPLHPVGLLVMNGWFIGQSWISIFIGWFLKVMIVKYGGAQGYRLARPLFIGMIAGEVIAAIIWAIVPVLHIYLFGGDPAEVGKIIIIPQ